MKKLVLAASLVMLICQCAFSQVGVNIFDYHFNSVPTIDPNDDVKYKEDGAYYFFINRMTDNLITDEGSLICYDCNHYMGKFITDEMAEKSNSKTFYDPTKVFDFHARVIHPDGTIVMYDKDSIRKVVESDDDGNEDTVFKVIYDLKAGDIIESYTVVEGQPAITGGSILASSSIFAVKDFQWTLIFPAHLKFDVKLYNTDETVIDTILKTHNTPDGEIDQEARYMYVHLTEVPPFRDEPHSMPAHYAPRVAFTLAYNLARGRSRITSVNQFAHNVYSTLYDMDKSDVKAAKSFVKEIGIDKNMTTEQKVRAIENHLKTKYHAYDINHSFFSTISVIRQMGFGNDLAFLKLYNYLFDAFKIDHNVVFTTDKNERAFDKKFEGSNFMQEALFYFPELDMYLYPMDKLRLGLTNTDFTGNDGAFMEKMTMGKATTFVPTFKTIKPLPYTANYDSLNVTLSVVPTDKQLKGTVEHVIKGYRAVPIQANMADFENEQEDYVIEHYLGFGNENILITGEKYYNNKPEDIAINPLKLTAKFSTSDCATYSSKQIDLTIGAFIGEQSKMEWKQERLLPVDLDNTHYAAYRIILDIPAGYSLNENYKNLDRAIYDTDNASTAGAGFVITTEVKDGKLIINGLEFYKKDHYEVSEYENILKVWDASYEFNKAKITLVKN